MWTKYGDTEVLRKIHFCSVPRSIINSLQYIKTLILQMTLCPFLYITYQAGKEIKNGRPRTYGSRTKALKDKAPKDKSPVILSARTEAPRFKIYFEHCKY